MPNPTRIASAAAAADVGNRRVERGARCAWTARLTSRAPRRARPRARSGSSRTAGEPARGRGSSPRASGRIAVSASPGPVDPGPGGRRPSASGRPAGGGGGGGASATCDDQDPLGLATEVAARPRARGVPASSSWTKGKRRRWRRGYSPRWAAEARLRSSDFFLSLSLRRAARRPTAGRDLRVVDLAEAVDQALPLVGLQDLRRTASRRCPTPGPRPACSRRGRGRRGRPSRRWAAPKSPSAR